MRKPFFILLGIWIIVSCAGLYIRLYPLWGHIWSPTSEQSTLIVLSKIKQSLLESIHAQNPQMSLTDAQPIAAAQLNEVLHKEPQKVRRAIENLNRAMSQKSGAKEPIYLLESDPFYYYNLTENLVEKGRIADTIQGNKYFNPLMGAPFGYWQPFSIHPYFGLGLYKIAQIFDPHIPLMSAVAFTPLVICVFCFLAFIWCARLFGLGYAGILTACFYFALLPVFLKRSSLGWYDTDPYNLLFPFLMLGIFFKAFEHKKVTHAAVAGIILALVLLFYSLIWQGWVFLFFMTFISSFCIAVYAWITRKDLLEMRRQALLAGTFLITTVGLGTLIYGVSFFSFFTEGSGELSKFTVKGLQLWPNLFLEVGELKRSTWTDALNNAGGPEVLECFGHYFRIHVFLSVSALGLVRSLYKLSLKTVMAALFLLIAAVMTTKAERFMIFTLVPLSLFFGAGVDFLIKSVDSFLTRYSKTIKMSAGFIIILALLFWGWSNSQYNIRTVLTPIYNSAWEDALLAIKQQTPQNSIVNTWWPPGHFIKAIAQRRVPFDGASLSEGQIGYWMANVFLSTDEHEARGLLRMINVSGNNSSKYLTDRGLKTSQAVTLLRLIAPQDIAQARMTLKTYLNAQDIEGLLKLTHGMLPHNYLLIYNEIVDENIGLTFIARRNMQAIEAINADPQKLARIPKEGSKDFIDFLWGLSGGPSKFSDPLPLMDQNAQGLEFSEGLNIRTDMNAATIRSQKFGSGIPASIVYEKNGRIIEQVLPNATLNYSVVLYTLDKQYTCRLMDRELANSLMMKLFYFDGKGLECFKLLKSANDLTGRTQIKVFKVVN